MSPPPGTPAQGMALQEGGGGPAGDRAHTALHSSSAGTLTHTITLTACAPRTQCPPPGRAGCPLEGPRLPGPSAGCRPGAQALGSHQLSRPPLALPLLLGLGARVLCIPLPPPQGGWVAGSAGPPEQLYRCWAGTSSQVPWAWVRPTDLVALSQHMALFLPADGLGAGVLGSRKAMRLRAMGAGLRLLWAVSACSRLLTAARCLCLGPMAAGAHSPPGLPAAGGPGQPRVASTSCEAQCCPGLLAFSRAHCGQAPG